MVTYLLFISLHRDFQLSEVHSGGKSKQKRKQCKHTQTTGKYVVSRDSGI